LCLEWFWDHSLVWDWTQDLPVHYNIAALILLKTFILKDIHLWLYASTICYELSQPVPCPDHAFHEGGRHAWANTKCKHSKLRTKMCYEIAIQNWLENQVLCSLLWKIILSLLTSVSIIKTGMLIFMLWIKHQSSHNLHINMWTIYIQF
jgi:hypothetical protein